MLRPADLTSSQYKMATKPGLGYEKQLFVSLQQHTEIGVLDIVATNSGVFTPSVPDVAALADVPQELMAMLDDGVTGDAALSFTVGGTDASGAGLTGTVAVTPPAYAQDQTFNFRRGWTHQVVTADATKKFKTLTSITAIVADAKWVGAKIRIFGAPSADATASGTFKQVAVKVSLGADPLTPTPTAVQEGRRKGRYIKLGEIDVGSLDLSAKVVTDADGLSRVLGRRVTGWIKETKEEKLHTQNIFLLGLIISAKEKTGESVEPNTLEATAMYEDYAFILAH